MNRYVIRYLIVASDGKVRSSGLMDVSRHEPLNLADIATNDIVADIVSRHPNVVAEFGILTTAEIAVTSVVGA